MQTNKVLEHVYTCVGQMLMMKNMSTHQRSRRDSLVRPLHRGVRGDRIQDGNDKKLLDRPFVS